MPGQPVMVRAVNLPLVMPVIGNNALLRGETIRVKLQGIDLISLDVHAQFLESLEKPLGFNASAQSDGSSSLTGAEDLDDLLAQDENDDTLSLGPLNISVDMDSEEDGEKNGNEKSGSEKTANIDAAATDGAASDTAATDVLAS